MAWPSYLATNQALPPYGHSLDGIHGKVSSTFAVLKDRQFYGVNQSQDTSNRDRFGLLHQMELQLEPFPCDPSQMMCKSRSNQYETASSDEIA